MFQPEYIEEEGPEPGYPAGLFSNSQTVLILTVMVGCFGVLWPKGTFRNLEKIQRFQPSITSKSIICSS